MTDWKITKPKTYQRFKNYSHFKLQHDDILHHSHTIISRIKHNLTLLRQTKQHIHSPINHISKTFFKKEPAENYTELIISRQEEANRQAAIKLSSNPPANHEHKIVERKSWRKKSYRLLNPDEVNHNNYHARILQRMEQDDPKRKDKWFTRSRI